MSPCLFFIAGLAASGATLAADSCAVQAARLIQQAKLPELSAMFTQPGEDVARRLAGLAGDIDPIEEVLPLSRQTPGVHLRKTVAVASLPSSYQFDGSWALATTRSGARYEVQASSVPGAPCSLLALHLGQLSN